MSKEKAAVRDDRRQVSRENTIQALAEEVERKVTEEVRQEQQARQSQDAPGGCSAVPPEKSRSKSVPSPKEQTRDGSKKSDAEEPAKSATDRAATAAAAPAPAAASAVDAATAAAAAAAGTAEKKALPSEGTGSTKPARPPSSPTTDGTVVAYGRTTASDAASRSNEDDDTSFGVVGALATEPLVLPRYNYTVRPPSVRISDNLGMLMLYMLADGHRPHRRRRRPGRRHTHVAGERFTRDAPPPSRASSTTSEPADAEAADHGAAIGSLRDLPVMIAHSRATSTERRPDAGLPGRASDRTDSRASRTSSADSASHSETSSSSSAEDDLAGLDRNFSALLDAENDVFIIVGPAHPRGVPTGPVSRQQHQQHHHHQQQHQQQQQQQQQQRQPTNGRTFQAIPPPPFGFGGHDILIIEPMNGPHAPKRTDAAVRIASANGAGPAAGVPAAAGPGGGGQVPASAASRGSDAAAAAAAVEPARLSSDAARQGPPDIVNLRNLIEEIIRLNVAESSGAAAPPSHGTSSATSRRSKQQQGRPNGRSTRSGKRPTRGGGRCGRRGRGCRRGKAVSFVGGRSAAGPRGQGQPHSPQEEPEQPEPGQQQQQQPERQQQQLPEQQQPQPPQRQQQNKRPTQKR